MKLRNKETGKIRNFEFVAITKGMGAEFAEYAHNAPVLICRSIDQLNEEWEDYKPTEPLIKDEKVRKAVRAWAEACDVEKCHYDGDGDFATRWHGIKLDCSQIELDEGHYTIAELCGEEEE
jgi:hypothetical protein